MRKRIVKAEDNTEDQMFKLNYSVEPRYAAKMDRLFEKFDLDWKEEEWIDGEMFGVLTGSKENLIKFYMGGYKDSSRRDAESMITPVKKIRVRVCDVHSKSIRIRVYNAYGKSSRPWYVSRELMDKKTFNRRVRHWKVQEFKKSDSWRCSTAETYSWEKGFINTLHD